MKTRIYLFAMLLMCSCLGMSGKVAAKELTREQAEVRVEQIQHRVAEIKAMDLEHLGRTDKVVLKKELKGMNKELRSMEPYIFISAGALIIIILLIILLL